MNALCFLQTSLSRLLSAPATTNRLPLHRASPRPPISSGAYLGMLRDRRPPTPIVLWRPPSRLHPLPLLARRPFQILQRFQYRLPVLGPGVITELRGLLSLQAALSFEVRLAATLQWVTHHFLLRLVYSGLFSSPEYIYIYIYIDFKVKISPTRTYPSLSSHAIACR